MNKIKWVAFQPLIGGCQIGAEAAFGCPPKYQLDYEGVENSDLYARYNEEVRGLHIPRYFLKGDLLSLSEEFIEPLPKGDIDAVVAVPLCSGLSSANTCTDENSSKCMGSNAIQNNNMLGILTVSLKYIKPKVFIFENAVKLATNVGAEIKDRLVKIANDYGYAVNLIKVNTKNHGSPQNRTRTFFIAWKDGKTRKLIPEYKPQPTIMDIIGDLKNQKSLLYGEPEQNWTNAIKAHFNNAPNFRDLWEETGVVTADFLLLIKENKWDWVLPFLNERQREKVPYFKNKHDQGKGWMSACSVWCGHNKIPSIFGRSMYRLLHPVEERGYSGREYMRLMGLPDDFPVPKKAHMIGQNVPVCTATYWCKQLALGLKGELEVTEQKYMLDDFMSAPRSKKPIGFEVFTKKDTY